jgi:hypothetical protein
MAKFRYLQSELPTEQQALLLSDLANIAGVALDQEEGRKRKLFKLSQNQMRTLYDLCNKLEKAGDRALDIVNAKTLKKT